MGEFTLNTTTKTEPGLRLLRNYSQVKYDLAREIDPNIENTIPHGYVEGSKIGLIKGSTYTVSTYTDNNVLLEAIEVIAVDSPVGGVMLPLSSTLYIIDGAKYTETYVSKEEIDGEWVETVHPGKWELGEGYWVPHNQYFISETKNSVWLKIEGYGESGLLTREEVSTIPLPIEALPKEAQKVFNPSSEYSQNGFRADPSKGLNLGEFTYFPKSLGLKVGDEYQLGFASPTDEWEPILFDPILAQDGYIPGSVMIFPTDLKMETTTYGTRASDSGSGDFIQDLKDSFGDKDKAKAKDSSKEFSYETLTVGLISDYCQVDNYGNVISGEGCVMASALFSNYDKAYVKEVLGFINIWDKLSSDQQEILLNEDWVPVLIGNNINNEPLQEIKSKIPTMEANITGVASSLGGLQKTVRDLNRMCGQRVDSLGFLVEDYGDTIQNTYGEVFNDYSTKDNVSLAAPYSIREGLKYNSDLNIIVKSRYTEKPAGWPEDDDSWKNWAQIVQTNDEQRDDKNNITKKNNLYRDMFNHYSCFTITVDDVGYPEFVECSGETEEDSDNNFYVYLGERLLDVEEMFPDCTIKLYPVHAALGLASHVEGITNYGFGIASHTQGANNLNVGDYGFVSGFNNVNDSYCGNLLGEGLIGINDCGMVIGCYNDPEIEGMFIVGNGERGDERNILTLDHEGNLNIAGELSNSGADYAEYYEWADGNPNAEDRTGHFVTFASGNKIRLAQPDDGYVLGIVSATPTVVGNSHKEQWQGKYMRDVYGRILTETIEHEEEIIRSEQEEVLEIKPAYTEVKPILNPNYDPSKEYIGRDKRPEWSPVGTHGQLVVLDDGSCQVDAFCTLGSNGMATAAAGATPYRVIERLDETHVKVVLK